MAKGDRRGKKRSLVDELATEDKQDDIIDAINSGFDPDDDVTTNISIVGVVTTLTATNGTKTQTTVIDKTDPNDFDIIETWS